MTTVVDSDGEPMRQAVRAEPTVVSPNVLEAEELVGHEFNDDEDRTIAVRELVELGAREAIMTAPTAASPISSRTAAPASTGSGWSRASRARRSDRATRSSPATCPPATPARRRRNACASGSPAGPSPPSTSGPGVIDPREVERLIEEITVESIEIPAEVS